MQSQSETQALFISPNRQPLHTVYGGAHLFKKSTFSKIGQLALESFYRNISSSSELRELLGASRESSDNNNTLMQKIYERVERKLLQEPVEDFRIDFEDGLGPRSDAEEDLLSKKAAEELAMAMEEQTLPPFTGIRVKAIVGPTAKRGIRTLEVFLETLLMKTHGKLPPQFCLTLPKVQGREEAEVINRLLKRQHGQQILLEAMVETPLILMNTEGKVPLRTLAKAFGPQFRSYHLGPYDLTSACEIPFVSQGLQHPVCDWARTTMKMALAGTTIQISDGPTTKLPLLIHKNPQSSDEKEQNRMAIWNSWRESISAIHHSLQMGIYQGWDLHPAQIPARYLACYHFFLKHFEECQRRLENFVSHAFQATSVGGTFDDAATGYGLLNFMLRAYECGAIDQGEFESVGLTLQEAQTRNFQQILESKSKSKSKAKVLK